MVEVAELQFLALLTRENYEGLPSGFGSEDQVTVFVPFSYQIGGLSGARVKWSTNAIENWSTP